MNDVAGAVLDVARAPLDVGVVPFVVASTGGMYLNMTSATDSRAMETTKENSREAMDWNVTPILGIDNQNPMLTVANAILCHSEIAAVSKADQRHRRGYLL